MTTTVLEFPDEVVTRALVQDVELPHGAGTAALVTLDNGFDHTKPTTFGPQSLLNIEVKGYAYGDAQCEGGSCTAEGEAGFSCSASNGNASDAGTVFGLLGAAAAFGMAFGRKRRQS